MNVLGTTGFLADNNTGGNDTTAVGSSGSMAAVKGTVDVYGNGSTYLVLDDSADTTGRSVSLGVNSEFGLSAGTIDWTPTSTTAGGVTSMNVSGGSGGNTFDVYGTSNFYGYTFLSSGTGNDFENVLGTTGYLYEYNPGGNDHTVIGSNAPNTSGGAMAGINGTVYVYGAGGTELSLDDSADATGRTATFTNGSVTGLAPAPIDWTPTSTGTGGVTYLLAHGGSGGNTFNVNDTSNFLFYTYIQTGTGNDKVNVTKTTGGLYVDNFGGNDTVVVGSNAPATSGGVLSAINGFVDVFGAGTIALTVDDSGDTTARTVTLTSARLLGLSSGEVDYSSDVTSLTVNGGTAANTYNVQGTLAGAATTLNAGSGNDAVNVANTSNKLDDIQGALTVNGQGGSDSMALNDTGQTAGWAYTLTGTAVTRAGIARVTFGTVESLALHTGSGNDTVTASAIPALPVTVNGGGGSDILVGPNATITWNVSGANSGNIGNLTFAAVESLTGGTGNDTFKFTGAGSLSGAVNGGAGPGVNELDLSAYTTPVTFKLAAGTATGTGGFVNIQTIGGNNTNATLVGPNAPSTWNVTGTNAGNVAGVTFSGFRNLTGGTGNDVFKLSNGAGISGTLDGGGGSNTVNESAYTTPVALNLSAGTLTGTAEFANLVAFVAGTASNTITGPNAVNGWVINAVNGGSVAGKVFTSFGKLVGGPNNDTFTFNDGKSVTGTVTGGGGTDTLSYAPYTTPVTVNLVTGVATGTGAISGITERDRRRGQRPHHGRRQRQHDRRRRRHRRPRGRRRGRRVRGRDDRAGRLEDLRHRHGRDDRRPGAGQRLDGHGGERRQPQRDHLHGGRQPRRQHQHRHVQDRAVGVADRHGQRRHRGRRQHARLLGPDDGRHGQPGHPHRQQHPRLLEHRGAGGRQLGGRQADREQRGEHLDAHRGQRGHGRCVRLLELRQPDRGCVERHVQVQPRRERRRDNRRRGGGQRTELHPLRRRRRPEPGQPDGDGRAATSPTSSRSSAARRPRTR